MAPRARVLLVVVLLCALSAAGCLELEVARVPDRWLEGPGGNGWEKNATASQREPTGGSTSKTQTLVYEDRRSDEGYPGTLTVTSLRTLLRPNEDKVLEVVEERIRQEAERKGIQIEGAPTKGARALANGHESSWFAYKGRVSTAGFFSRNAEVRIFGEVFQCDRTVVATVGLAQVSDVRSVGGVPLPSDPDPATWREIVADPRGTVEGIRGSSGLAYHVEC